MIFLPVPKGRYRIGTTFEGVQSCVAEWRNRLINPCYQEDAFRDWIRKEFPDHSVESEAFELMRTPVTNGEVQNFVDQTNAAIPESITLKLPEDHPVWGVSREWALSFAAWMSEQDEMYFYRLPTETEWEIAARGHDFREYPYGSIFNPGRANTRESGLGQTTPVERYSTSPGPFGHLDLAGNVEEWVDSHYTVYQGGDVIQDDLFERFGMNYFILRGGSFACGGDLSRGARRHGPFPDPLFRFTGFRLVRELRITK